MNTITRDRLFAYKDRIEKELRQILKSVSLPGASQNIDRPDAEYSSVINSFKKKIDKLIEQEHEQIHNVQNSLAQSVHDIYSLFVYEPLYVTCLIFILDLDIYEFTFFVNDFVSTSVPESAWALLMALQYACPASLFFMIQELGSFYDTNIKIKEYVDNYTQVLQPDIYVMIAGGVAAQQNHVNKQNNNIEYREREISFLLAETQNNPESFFSVLVAQDKNFIIKFMNAHTTINKSQHITSDHYIFFIEILRFHKEYQDLLDKYFSQSRQDEIVIKHAEDLLAMMSRCNKQQQQKQVKYLMSNTCFLSVVSEHEKLVATLHHSVITFLLRHNIVFSEQLLIECLKHQQFKTLASVKNIVSINVFDLFASKVMQSIENSQIRCSDDIVVVVFGGCRAQNKKLSLIRYLAKHHKEVLTEIISMKSIDEMHMAMFEFIQLMFYDKKKDRIKIDDYVYECNQGQLLLDDILNSNIIHRRHHHTDHHDDCDVHQNIIALVVLLQKRGDDRLAFHVLKKLLASGIVRFFDKKHRKAFAEDVRWYHVAENIAHGSGSSGDFDDLRQNRIKKVLRVIYGTQTFNIGK